ncbi:MAG: D-tyrosyl-tRNA(Tyr) deacylase [Ruminococcaceae bacterium]|nr:D-tyrosyl-tRNA(Tyr) deacylase [Oscillospiraceae bacterium]
MIALIQRTTNSSVTIDGKIYSEAGKGFLILLGVFVNDSEKQAEMLASKIAKLRIFEDENGKMNLSPLNLLERGEQCEMMVVSQFTLCAECKGQNRPSFINAARPEAAIPLYEKFVDLLRLQGFNTYTGEFGAEMKVSLLNDGPITIILDTDKL